MERAVHCGKIRVNPSKTSQVSRVEDNKHEPTRVLDRHEAQRQVRRVVGGTPLEAHTGSRIKWAEGLGFHELHWHQHNSIPLRPIHNGPQLANTQPRLVAAGVVQYSVVPR